MLVLTGISKQGHIATVVLQQVCSVVKFCHTIQQRHLAAAEIEGYKNRVFSDSRLLISAVTSVPSKNIFPKLLLEFPH